MIHIQQPASFKQIQFDQSCELEDCECSKFPVCGVLSHHLLGAAQTNMGTSGDTLDLKQGSSQQVASLYIAGFDLFVLLKVLALVFMSFFEVVYQDGATFAL